MACANVKVGRPTEVLEDVKWYLPPCRHPSPSSRPPATRLLADGYAGLSTRKVAEEAGVPLSQLHYHFGSKGGLILALLET